MPHEPLDPTRPLRIRGKRHNRHTDRVSAKESGALHGTHSGKVFVRSTSQGYGQSDTQRASETAQYFDVSEGIEESTETHIIPRRSATRKNYLEEFHKPTLLKRGVPFQYPILKRETSKSHRIEPDKYLGWSGVHTVVSEASRPDDYRNRIRHGDVKQFTEIEIDKLNHPQKYQK